MKFLGTAALATLVVMLTSTVCSASVVPARCFTVQGVAELIQQRECMFVNDDRCPPGWTQSFTSLCDEGLATQNAIFCCRD